MNRRDFIATAGTIATLAAVTAPALAEEHEHHHHGDGPYAMLVHRASDCVISAEACLAHCLDLFAAQDTSVAACAKTVTEVLAVCGALTKIALANSPRLVAYAHTAEAFCRACADECKKHADKHAPCKACMDACLACADECAKAA